MKKKALICITFLCIAILLSFFGIVSTETGYRSNIPFDWYQNGVYMGHGTKMVIDTDRISSAGTIIEARLFNIDVRKFLYYNGEYSEITKEKRVAYRIDIQDSDSDGVCDEAEVDLGLDPYKDFSNGTILNDFNYVQIYYDQIEAVYQNDRYYSLIDNEIIDVTDKIRN